MFMDINCISVNIYNKLLMCCRFNGPEESSDIPSLWQIHLIKQILFLYIVLIGLHINEQMMRCGTI